MEKYQLRYCKNVGKNFIPHSEIRVSAWNKILPRFEIPVPIQMLHIKNIA